MASKSQVNKWLEKAKNDFEFSASILPETTFYSQVCFFFQQSAEKYLKSYIVKHDLEFKKIHDLLVLLDICQKKDGKFSCLIEDCQFLNTLYIDTRYPVNWPADVTKEEAIKAKESAQRIKEFVEKLLLLDGQV